MTTQLAKHAVIQITLVAYCVLISGAGVRLAKIVERPTPRGIQFLHDYGFLLLLIPTIWFLMSLRDSQHAEPSEVNYRNFISYLATCGSVALLVGAFCLSLAVLIDCRLGVSKQKDAQKPLTIHGVTAP